MRISGPLWRAAVLLLTCVLLAACGGAPTGSDRSASPTATATVTPNATATFAPPVTQTFTCPATVNGAVKIFSDSGTGLQFDYPAAWTEKDCQRFVAENISPSGSTIAGQSIVIGNLFIVAVSPRRGLAIQQLVNQVEGSDETVTLTPLAIAHAVAAAQLSVTVSPAATHPPRFAQTLAIVEGSQNFYEVSGLVAQMSMTDTMPGISNAALIQQVVTTFDVP